MSFTRELTPSEAKAVNLIKIFEEAIDHKRMTITLHGTRQAAEAVYKLETVHKKCKAMKVDWIPGQDKYAITFSVTEFHKYLLCMLEATGLQLQIDGSLKTFDNLVISNEYLN